MFSKKNKDTARKIAVKNESPEERKVEIKVNLKPLVSVEQHVLSVNGREGKPQYRISVADRDVITLSGREYHELFMEMLRHKDAGELVHDISVAHMEEHAREAMGGRDIEEILNGLGSALEKALGGKE